MQTSILLIDDNAVQAATRQAILRRAGYSVLCALNPEQALEQLRDSHYAEGICLIITDHVMPGMNGAGFVRNLRALYPHLPVLVISGLDEAESQYEGLNVSFRLKPLLPDDLLSTVAGLLHT
ncbi:MAG: response regulator [Acidobacteriaceae bacterium]